MGKEILLEDFLKQNPGAVVSNDVNTQNVPDKSKIESNGSIGQMTNTAGNINSIVEKDKAEKVRVAEERKKSGMKEIPLEEFLKANPGAQVEGPGSIDGIKTPTFDSSVLEQKIGKIRSNIYDDPNIREDYKQYLMGLRLSNTIDDKQLEEVKKTLSGKQAIQQEDNWWTRGATGAVEGAGTATTLAGVASLAGGPVSLGATLGVGAAVGFAYGALNDQAHFYLDEKGIPQPLGYGERPPKEARIASVYSSMFSAADDSAGTALGKSIANSIITTGRAIPSLAQLITGVVTGDQLDSKFLNEIANNVQSHEFELDPAAAKQIVSVDKDGVGLNFDNLNWHSAAAMAGQAIGSMAAFLGTGKMMGAQKEAELAEKAFVISKQAKLGLATGQAVPRLSMAEKLALRSPWKAPKAYGASILISMTEAADAAERAGIKGSTASAFALMSGIGVGALEMLIGGQELNVLARKKILVEAAEALTKKTSKTALHDAGRVAVKSIDEKGIQEIYSEIQKAGIKTMLREGISSMVQTSVSEGSEEFIQGLYSQAIQVLSDKTTGEKQYGTDMLSWESAADDVNNFLSGLAGAPIGLLTHQKEQTLNQDIIAHVAKGDGAVTNLKKQLEFSKEQGQISQEDYDLAMNRIATIKEYNESVKKITKDYPEETKQELLNSLFQRNFAKEQADKYEQDSKANPADAIAEAHASVYRSEEKEYQNKINDILATPAEKHQEEANKKKEEELKNDLKPEGPNTTDGEIIVDDPSEVTNSIFFKEAKAKNMNKDGETSMETPDELANKIVDSYIPEEIRQKNHEGAFVVEEKKESGESIQYENGQMIIDEQAPIPTTSVKDKDGNTFIVGISPVKKNEETGKLEGDAVIALEHQNEMGEPMVSYARYTHNQEKVDPANNVFSMEALPSALNKISGKFDRTPVINEVSEEDKQTSTNEEAVKSIKTTKAKLLLQKRNKKNPDTAENLKSSKEIEEHFNLDEKSQDKTSNIPDILINTRRKGSTAKPARVHKGMLYIDAETKIVKSQDGKSEEEVVTGAKDVQMHRMVDANGVEYLMGASEAKPQYEYEDNKLITDLEGNAVPLTESLKQKDGTSKEEQVVKGQVWVVQLNKDGGAAFTKTFYYQKNGKGTETASNTDDLIEIQKELGLTPAYLSKKEEKAEEKKEEIKSEDHTGEFKNQKDVIEQINKRNQEIIKNEEADGHGYHKIINGIKEFYKSVHEILHGKSESIPSMATVAGTYADAYLRDIIAGTKGEEGTEAANHMTAQGKKDIEEVGRKIKDYFKRMGEIPLTNDIKLFSDRMKVAGETDIITVDSLGNIRIYDLKTTGNRANIASENEKGELVYGKSFNDYQKQLSCYKSLFEEMYGVPVSNLAIIAIEIGKKGEKNKPLETLINSANFAFDNIYPVNYDASIRKFGFLVNKNLVPLNFISRIMLDKMVARIKKVTVKAPTRVITLSNQRLLGPATTQEAIQQNPILNTPGQDHVKTLRVSQQEKLDNLRNREARTQTELVRLNAKRESGAPFILHLYPVISRRLTARFKKIQRTQHRTLAEAQAYAKAFYEDQRFKISDPNGYNDFYGSEIREAMFANLAEHLDQWLKGENKHVLHLSENPKDFVTASVVDGKVVFLDNNPSSRDKIIKTIKTGRRYDKAVELWNEYILNIVALKGYGNRIDELPDNLNPDQVTQAVIDEGDAMDFIDAFIPVHEKENDEKANKSILEDSQIADAIGTLSLESFASFGDRNFITPQIKRNWFSKTSTRSLDEVKDSLHVIASDEKDQQDFIKKVVDFIVDNPDGKKGFYKRLKKNQTNRQLSDLSLAFENKYGIPLTYKFAKDAQERHAYFAREAAKRNSESKKGKQENEEGNEQSNPPSNEGSPTGTEREDLAGLIINEKVFNGDKKNEKLGFTSELKHLWLTHVLKRFGKKTSPVTIVSATQKETDPKTGKLLSGITLGFTVEGMKGTFFIKMYNHIGQNGVKAIDGYDYQDKANWTIENVGTKTYGEKTYENVLVVKNAKGELLGNIAESNFKENEGDATKRLEDRVKERTKKSISQNMMDRIDQLIEYHGKKAKESITKTRKGMNMNGPADMFSWALHEGIKQSLKAFKQIMKMTGHYESAIEGATRIGVIHAKALIKSYNIKEKEPVSGSTIESLIRESIIAKEVNKDGTKLPIDPAAPETEEEASVSEENKAANNKAGTAESLSKLTKKFKHLFVNPTTQRLYLPEYDLVDLMDIAWSIARNAKGPIKDVRQYYIDHWPADNKMGQFWKDQTKFEAQDGTQEEGIFFTEGFLRMHSTLKDMRRYAHLNYMNSSDKRDGIAKGYEIGISNTKKSRKSVKTDVFNVARNAAANHVQKRIQLLDALIAKAKTATTEEEIKVLITPEAKKLIGEAHLKYVWAVLKGLMTKETDPNLTAENLYFGTTEGLMKAIGEDGSQKVQIEGITKKIQILAGQTIDSARIGAKALYGIRDDVRGSDTPNEVRLDKHHKNEIAKYLPKWEKSQTWKNIEEIIKQTNQLLEDLTGIPADYWRAYHENYAVQNGFTSLELYTLDKFINYHKYDSLKNKRLFLEKAPLEALRFVLAPEPGSNGMTLEKLKERVDAKSINSNQLATIQAGLNNREQLNAKEFAPTYSGVDGKTVGSDELLSELTNILEDAETLEDSPEFERNSFVRNAVNKGVVIARIDGISNKSNNEAANRGELSDSERAIISVLNFLKGDVVAGEGRYMQMLDQQSDSSSSMYAVAVEKKNLQEEDAIKAMQSYTYYTKTGPKEGEKLTYEQAKAEIKRNVESAFDLMNQLTDEDNLVISLPKYESQSERSKSPNYRGKNNKENTLIYKAAEQFIYNWITNKSDLDNYLYGEQGKKVSYRESVKRKMDGKGFSPTEGIEGGVGSTQRLIVINDPILSKIFSGSKVLADLGEKGQEYADGGVLLFPSYNKKLAVSTEGETSGQSKAYTYWKDKDGNNNLIKGNDVALPDPNDGDPLTKEFYEKNPFLKEFVEWGEQNHIDRLAFSSTAKLNKSNLSAKVDWDIDEANMTIRGIKLKEGETVADHLTERLITSNKVVEVPTKNYRIMNNLANDGKPNISKIPVQMINVLRSTKQGPEIDRLINQATEQKLLEFKTFINKGQDQLAFDLIKKGPGGEEQMMLLKGWANGSITFSDPIAQTILEKFFRNVVEKEMLNLVAPKSLATQLRIPGFTQVKQAGRNEETNKATPSEIMVPANMMRSPSNKNGVIVGDTVIIVRVPTDDMHSIQVVKIAGFLPASMKNAVIGDQQSMYVSGHDLDGDQSHIITKFKGVNGYEETSGYNGTINKILDQIVKAYADTSNFDRTVRPISVEKVDQFEKEMNLEKEKLHPLSWTDWRYMANANNSGSDVLSMTAAATKTVYNLIVGKIKAKTIYLPVFNTKTKQWESVLQHTLDGWDVSPKRAQEIFEEMANQVNYAADDVKNATLSKIAKSSSNAGLIDYIASQRPDAMASSIMLLKHPVSQLYFAIKEWKESPLGKAKKSQGTNAWLSTIMKLSTQRTENGLLKDFSLPSSEESYIDPSTGQEETAESYFYKADPTANSKDLNEILSKDYEKLKLSEKIRILRLIKDLSDASSDLSEANKMFNLNNSGIASFGQLMEMIDKIGDGPEEVFKFINKDDFKSMWNTQGANDGNSRAKANIVITKAYTQKLPIYSRFGAAVLGAIKTIANPLKLKFTDFKTKEYDKVKAAFDQWRVVEALHITESKAELFKQVSDWYNSLPVTSPMVNYLKLDVDRFIFNPDLKKTVENQDKIDEMQLAFEALTPEEQMMLAKYQIREHKWTHSYWNGGFYHVIGPTIKTQLQNNLERVDQKLNSTFGAYKVVADIMKSRDGLIPYVSAKVTATENGFILETQNKKELVALPTTATYVKTKYNGVTTFFERATVVNPDGSEEIKNYYKKIGTQTLDNDMMPVFNSLEPIPFEAAPVIAEQPKSIEDAIKEADSKEPIAQNFFDGYRPNSDTSKTHTIRPEITAKYGSGVKTFTLVKDGIRTRTTRLAGWMKKNNPKVGDHFWQINEKNPNDKVLTKITAIYGNTDPRFKDNWNKEGWIDSNFEYVKGYDAAIEFEVVPQESKSSTPEYDKLPSQSETPTMTYAGIGSRETPPDVQAKMTEVAKYLEKLGYTANTGDADGADAAIRAGAKKANIFTSKGDATEQTRKIAREIHPNPPAVDNAKNKKGEDISHYVWGLHARNTNQIFGKDLNTPVDFVLAWTKDGGPTGGTGQAIRYAMGKGIPVINLYNKNWRDQLKAVLAQKSTQPSTDLSDRIKEGDIWTSKGIPVITTNLGGVHGAGLANQAFKKGHIQYNQDGDFGDRKNVITFPVKKVWSDKTDIALLKSSAGKLVALANMFPENNYSLPLIGLGHGEGNINEILPIIKAILERTDNVTLVLPTSNVDRGKQGTARADNSLGVVDEVKKYFDKKPKPPQAPGDQTSLEFDYQRNDGTSRPRMDRAQAEKIRLKLQKNFPNIIFFKDANAFEEWAHRNGATGHLDMTAMGARFKNAYWINPESGTQESYFHENAHIFWDMLSDDDIVKQKMSALLGGDMEAAVAQIGKSGADLSGPVYRRFVHYMKLFWGRVRQAIWGDRTVEQYAAVMADRMWKGESDFKSDFDRFSGTMFDYMRAKKDRLTFTTKQEQTDEILKAFGVTDIANITVNNVFYKSLLGKDIDEKHFWTLMLSRMGSSPITIGDNGVLQINGANSIVASNITRNNFAIDYTKNLNAIEIETHPDTKISVDLKDQIFGQGRIFERFEKLLGEIAMRLEDSTGTVSTKVQFEKLDYDTLKEQLKEVNDFIIDYSQHAYESWKTAKSLDGLRGYKAALEARITAMLIQKGLVDEKAFTEQQNKIFTEAVYGMMVLNLESIDPVNVQKSIVDGLGGKNNTGAMMNPTHVQDRFAQLAVQLYSRAVQKARESEVRMKEEIRKTFEKITKSGASFDEITYDGTDKFTGKKFYVAPGSTMYNNLLGNSDAKSRAIIQFADEMRAINMEFQTHEIIEASLHPKSPNKINASDQLIIDRVAFVKADIDELIKRHGLYEALLTAGYGDSIVDKIHAGAKDAAGKLITLEEYKVQQNDLFKKKLITSAQLMANVRKEQHTAEKMYQGDQERDRAEFPIVRHAVGSMVRGIVYDEDPFTAIGSNKKDPNKARMQTLEAAANKLLSQSAVARELGDSKILMDATQKYLEITAPGKADTAQWLQNFNDWKLYGKGAERSNLSMSWQRYLSALAEYTGIKFLAFNLPAAGLNMATGIVQIIRELGPRKFMIGFYRVMTTHLQYIFDPSKQVRKEHWLSDMFVNSKMMNILEKNQIVELQKDWSTSDSTRLFGKLKGVLFSPIAAVEFFNHSVTLAGMMTPAQYNAYDKKGNVIPGREADALNEDQWISFIHQDNELIHGAYHTFNKRLISATPEGKGWIQMKSWMPSIYTLHMGEDKFVGATDERSIGILTSLIAEKKNIWKVITSLAHADAKGAQQILDNIPDYKKDALLRGVNEIVLMAILTLGAASYGDDEKKDLSYIKLQKLISDLGFIYDINNFKSLLTSPVPVASTLIAIGDATAQVAKTAVGVGPVYKAGKHEGESRTLQYVIKASPVSGTISSAEKMFGDK